MAEAPTTVRLAAEYHCWPLWLQAPGGIADNIDPADLGLPPGLRADLLAWAEEFDRTLDEDYPPDSGFPTPEAAAAFDARGHALRAATAAALGPGYEVVYTAAG